MKDADNLDIIDRVEEILGSPSAVTVVWHKTCYSLYTSKDKLKRQQQKLTHGQARGPSTATSSPRKTRSHVRQVNWNKCIFCQEQDKKNPLSSVMTLEMSDGIIDAAKYSYTMRTRLADVIDLIASEAKYHLSCYSSSPVVIKKP